MTLLRNVKVKCENVLISHKKYTFSVILAIIFLQQLNTFFINTIKDSYESVNNDKSSTNDQDPSVKIKEIVKNPNLDYDCQCKEMQLVRNVRYSTVVIHSKYVDINSYINVPNFNAILFCI